MAINLSAAFHAMASAIPDMKARKWGRILSTASAHSLVASPFKSAHVTAKHGLAGLTKTAALELATFGVTVNCVSPGYVWTPLVEKQIPDTMAARNMTREQVIHDVILLAQPTKQFVTADQVALLFVFSVPMRRRRSREPIIRSMAAGPLEFVAGWHGGRERSDRLDRAKKVSLALQGGGSHGAFTWGVLDYLLEDARLDIEAITGTSAGAMNAVVQAEAYLEGGRDGARKSLAKFWRSISDAGAFSPAERKFLDTFFRCLLVLDRQIAWAWARGRQAMAPRDLRFDRAGGNPRSADGL